MAILSDMTTTNRNPRNHAPHPTHGTRLPGGLTDATIYRPLCSAGGTRHFGLVDKSIPVNCKRCLDRLANQSR